jgi:hypothetical protein
MNSQSQMLAIRRIGHEHEPRHARLEDDRASVIEPHNNALSKPIDRRNQATDQPAIKADAHGRNENGPGLRTAALDCHNTTTDNARDPAAHGFDFG